MTTTVLAHDRPSADADRSPADIRLAVDIGGTFTDVVLEVAGQRHSCKVLTTHQAPEQAVIEGIERLLRQSGTDASQIALFIHGTTLATNALIERKGARTALLTTEGFRDVLAMGFEKRFDVYDLQIEGARELVPRPDRFTVRERMAADGSVLLPLDEENVREAARKMRERGVEAVAVGFLHAWKNPAHEARARDILRDVLGEQVTICLSGEVCPEIREYERISTTVANAYVRPLMASYLMRLQQQVQSMGMQCPLLLMMSGGGLTTLAQATRFPIRLVESGPAGGAILAAHLSRECRLDKVLAYDMGGTTAKICLIKNGQPERSRRFEVARAWKNLKGSGLPVRIPVIELVEIGAGGGSIGRVDALGRITVGPDSCGSEPGPACYGRGGQDPAVTDANVILGRIEPDHFAGGRMPLDGKLSEQALLRNIGQHLQMDAFWSAAGISEIVEENMANAARVHAIERGEDLEDFTMIAFGGAAPLHAGRLAQKLGVRKVLVPMGAGVGSAIGFLRAPISFEVVRSELQLLSNMVPDVVRERLQAMSREARAIVAPASLGVPLIENVVAELRYAGQGHELRISLDITSANDIDRDVLNTLGERYEQAYAQAYGMRVQGSQVELVTWSVTVSTEALPAKHSDWAPSPHPRLADRSRTVWDPSAARRLDFSVHRRLDLQPCDVVLGPALICEDETTLVVPDHWQARRDNTGHLLMEALG